MNLRNHHEVPYLPFSKRPFLKKGEKLISAVLVIGPPYARGQLGSVLHVSMSLRKKNSKWRFLDCATDSELANNVLEGNGIPDTCNYSCETHYDMKLCQIFTLSLYRAFIAM